MKVSVVVPFFNRNELLRCSLASVLAQTVPAHEILVVDDCSPEETGWLAQEFPTVRVLRLPQNKGPSGARYQGALAATGTHIATLDMDDHWYPEKLEKQVAFANKIGDPRGIYSHQQWVEEDAGGGGVRPRTGPRPGEPLSEYLYVRNEFIQSNTLLMARDLYLQLCHISDDAFADDWEMVMRGDADRCRIYVLEEALSHWNCTSDPQRHSQWVEGEHERNFLPRLSYLFTPKAKAAFLGRQLAPRLARQGRFLTCLKFLGQALIQGALSPLAVLKISLLSLFPRFYKKCAGWYGRLRHKRSSRGLG